MRKGDRRWSLCMGWSSVTACLVKPGSWCLSLGSGAEYPDLLHCPHQQILGERKNTQRREKPDVTIASSQLAGGASTGHGAVDQWPGAVACGGGF